jgi:hypothetical protein
MDMAFLRRAERILEERESLRLDHQLLVAALAAQQQTATVTARSRAVVMQARIGPSDEDPLIEVLLAGPRWREAATRQRGCFSRAEAGRRVNGA